MEPIGFIGNSLKFDSSLDSNEPFKFQVHNWLLKKAAMCLNILSEWTLKKLIKLKYNLSRKGL